MGLSTFSIKVTPASGHVEVNGQDLSTRVSALRLDASPRDVPRLTLEILGEGTIEGEGVVYAQPSDADARQIVRDLVEGMDADELDRLSLSRMTTLGTTPGQAFKEALLELLG